MAGKTPSWFSHGIKSQDDVNARLVGKLLIMTNPVWIPVVGRGLNTTRLVGSEIIVATHAFLLPYNKCPGDNTSSTLARVSSNGLNKGPRHQSFRDRATSGKLMIPVDIESLWNPVIEIRRCLWDACEQNDRYTYLQWSLGSQGHLRACFQRDFREHSLYDTFWTGKLTEIRNLLLKSVMQRTTLIVHRYSISWARN